MSDSEEDEAPDAEEYAFFGMRARVERQVRKGFGDRRISQGVSVYLCGAFEHVIKEILANADTRRLAAKAPRRSIDRLMLVGAVRHDEDVGRLFRNYQFAPTGVIKAKPSDLLTRNDRKRAIEKATKAREARRQLKEVPSVVDA